MCFHTCVLCVCVNGTYLQREAAVTHQTNGPGVCMCQWGFSSTHNTAERRNTLKGECCSCLHMLSCGHCIIDHTVLQIQIMLWLSPNGNFWKTGGLQISTLARNSIVILKNIFLRPFQLSYSQHCQSLMDVLFCTIYVGFFVCVWPCSPPLLVRGRDFVKHNNHQAASLLVNSILCR